MKHDGIFADTSNPKSGKKPKDIPPSRRIKQQNQQTRLSSSERTDEIMQLAFTKKGGLVLCSKREKWKVCTRDEN